MWANVTNALTTAAAALQDGQLVHSSHFAYDAAQWVVELGEPKLDVGLRPPPPAGGWFQGLLSTNFTAEGVLQVFDKLFQLEVRRGGALCRSVCRSVCYKCRLHY